MLNNWLDYNKLLQQNRSKLWNLTCCGWFEENIFYIFVPVAAESQTLWYNKHFRTKHL